MVVGGGPTGVEMAGQIGELARDTLRGDFRAIDPRAGARSCSWRPADRVLGTFPPSLSAKAARALERLGVTVLLERRWSASTATACTVEAPTAAERIPTRTVIWAAGVRRRASPSRSASRPAPSVDRAGRVTVEPDLTLPGHPEVVALGDMVRVRDRRRRAPARRRAGGDPAGPLRRRAGRATGSRGKQPPPFHYRDKGNLATIGRGRAVADLAWLRLSGFTAWLTWLLVHLWYLIGVPEPAAGVHALGDQLHHARPRRAADHRRRRVTWS